MAARKIISVFSIKCCVFILFTAVAAISFQNYCCPCWCCFSSCYKVILTQIADNMRRKHIYLNMYFLFMKRILYGSFALQFLPVESSQNALFVSLSLSLFLLVHIYQCYPVVNIPSYKTTKMITTTVNFLAIVSISMDFNVCIRSNGFNGYIDFHI